MKRKANPKPTRKLSSWQRERERERERGRERAILLERAHFFPFCFVLGFSSLRMLSRLLRSLIRIKTKTPKHLRTFSHFSHHPSFSFHLTHLHRYLPNSCWKFLLIEVLFSYILPSTYCCYPQAENYSFTLVKALDFFIFFPLSFFVHFLTSAAGNRL